MSFVVTATNPFTKEREEKQLENWGEGPPILKFSDPKDPHIVQTLRPYYLKRVDGKGYITLNGTDEKVVLFVDALLRYDLPQRYKSKEWEVRVILEPVFKEKVAESKDRFED